MDISNAFAALERLINAAAQDQYSESILQNARAGIARLRTKFIEDSHDHAILKDKCDLWQRRAEAQLQITRAAVAIVAAPFQIYDAMIGQRGYRISTPEFESLQRAVEAYKKLAAQESASATPTE